jgi:hypothetical protein
LTRSRSVGHGHGHVDDHVDVDGLACVAEDECWRAMRALKRTNLASIFGIGME